MGMVGNFLGFRAGGGRIERGLKDQLGGANSLAVLAEQQRRNAAMAQSLAHAATGGQAPGAAMRQSAGFLQNSNAAAQQTEEAARLREQQQAVSALNAFQAQRRSDNRGAFGNLLSTGASIGTFFSDKRTKRDVRHTDPKAMREFLRSAKAKDWSYRDEFGGESRTGPMAQDLERSEIGRKFVGRDQATGMRTIDHGGAVSALLSAAGSLNDRLERVERGKGGDDG